MKTHSSIRTFHFVFLIWLVLAGVFLAPAAGAAVDFEVVTALGSGLEGEGKSPQGVIKDSAGNLYGVTERGGNYDAGIVFKLDSSGNYSILHEFDSGDGGKNPPGSLVLDGDGNLYGITSFGGSSGGGIIFKLTPSGNFTVLYAFDGSSEGGYFPKVLIQASDGNFYGTTCCGESTGAARDGTIFKITPSGDFTVLHTFDGASGGGFPTVLIQGSDGNFYGTTSRGGSDNQGTIFKVMPSGDFTVLHSFNFISGGRIPSSLVQGSDGSFYGTTSYGSGGPISYQDGTVFKLDSSGNYSVLHDFDGSNDGANPQSLIQGIDGNFYGTTGSLAGGKIFKIDSSGNFNIIFSFGTSGVAQGALVQDSNGNLFGAALGSGVNGQGAVFELDSGGNFTVLHSFGFSYVDGASPNSELVQGSDGSFFGTTSSGGSNSAGTVFKLDPSGNYSVLHDFDGEDGGEDPGGVILGSDGNLYGTTSAGGSNNAGTIFKLTSSGNFTVLHSFDGSSGGSYPSGLIQAGDGNFYGTTIYGGSSAGLGTVFKLSSSGSFSILHKFVGPLGGVYPSSGVIQASDGNLYGTTQWGGTYGLGVVFKIGLSGSFSILHIFDDLNTGYYPVTKLLQASDGNFYGTTSLGGVNNAGTVFRLDQAGNFSVLHDFDDAGGGANALIQGSDGNLYGTTSFGGSNGDGTIFELTPSGDFTVLHSFDGASEGGNPEAGLIQASDGSFYGITSENGPYDGGSIFRLVETSDATLITLTSSLNPSVVGQSVTFTATVSGNNPTGTVEFFVGSTRLGSRPLSNGVAALSTPKLVAGTHSITAVYSGDVNNTSSTSAAVTQVVKAKTSTVLASRPNPSRFGVPVTFTATVRGRTPTGTVEFLDGTASLGTAAVGSDGKAKLSTSALGRGLHRISARYSGDGNNAGSTSAVLRQTVR
jgi:uncharacterized repeat protein (TIGR03803 family)